MLTRLFFYQVQNIFFLLSSHYNQSQVQKNFVLQILFFLNFFHFRLVHFLLPFYLHYTKFCGFALFIRFSLATCCVYFVILTE